MKLLVFLLKRLLQFLLLALFVTTCTFLIASLLPGDFFTAWEADPRVGRDLVSRLRAQYGLAEPIHTQYFHWLRRSLTLDLGYSLHHQLPVASVLQASLRNTLWIAIPSLVLGVLAGVLMGAVRATFTEGVLGQLLNVLSTVMLSLPALILGLSALVFAARTGWFPIGGMNSVNASVDSGLLSWWDRIRHLALPVACLSIPVLASVERVQYTSSIVTLTEPFFLAARTRGLTDSRIFLRYLIRPSLNPVISILGPMFGVLLSGSLVIELLFSWPGLGQTTYDALVSRDVFLLLGCVLCGSILLVVGNILADTMLYLLDPRTRSYSSFAEEK